MLLDIDVIAAARHRRHSVASMAGELGVSDRELKGKLGSLEARQLIRVGVAHHGPTTTNVTAVPLLEPAATEGIETLLGRVEEQMGMLDRFVIALADEAPAAMREAAMRLWQEIPLPETVDETELTLELGRLAKDCAVRAFRTAEEDADGQGLESVPVHSIEDFGVLSAWLAQSDYSKSIADRQVRDVLDQTAGAWTAGWDLRPLTAHDSGTNVSHSRSPRDPASRLEMADRSAHALRALAKVRPGVDPIAEASRLIDRLSR